MAALTKGLALLATLPESPERARHELTLQLALALSRHAEHPLSELHTEIWTALLAQGCLDVAATQAHAEVAIALARTHDSPLRVELGRILRGWALAMQGDTAAGVAHIHQGFAASHDLGGPPLLRVHWLAMLAEAYGQAGAARSRTDGPGRGLDADGHH